jgi:hypothetical protein
MLTCDKKDTLGGDRTHDHKIKSLALYHLSYEGNSYGKQKRWRIRVSIPVPRACKARTLPIELIPPRPMGLARGVSKVPVTKM